MNCSFRSLQRIIVWVHAFSRVGREAPVRTEPLPTIRVRFIRLNQRGLSCPSDISTSAESDIACRVENLPQSTKVSAHGVSTLGMLSPSSWIFSKQRCRTAIASGHDSLEIYRKLCGRIKSGLCADHQFFRPHGLNLSRGN